MKKQLQKIRYTLMCIVLMLVSVNVNAQEQLLLGWQFFNSNAGGKSVGDEEVYNATDMHFGINSSVLSRGDGLKAYALQTGFSSVPTVLTSDYASAYAGQSFFQFNFEPKADFKVSLSTLNAKVRLAGTWSNPAKSPFSYVWQYSINNGTDFYDIGAITTITEPTHTDGVAQVPLALSGIPELQDLDKNTNVIFRLYVWGFTNKIGTGTFGLGRSPSATDFALSLSGTVINNKIITSDRSEAYFTDAKAAALGQTSEVIIDKLVNLIDGTPTREYIHLSIYLINHQKVMDALKAAEGRGVNLHLIVDMSRSDSQTTNANSLPWLQTNLPNSEIIVSVNDVSSNAINHHKFALFSKIQTLDGVLNTVTFQTSHNFTVSDTKKIQDALLFNNSGIYQAFLTNWQTIKTNSASGMSKNFVYNTFNDNANGVKLAFFPKIGTGVSTTDDDIVQSLNAITDVANAKIRIAMSDWTDSRPAIVDKLIQLKAQGATIEVYTRDVIGSQTKIKLAQLATAGATVRIFNTEGAAARFNIHAKMMLIEGDWNGNSGAKVIMTGSHNYTDGALKTNNEVLVTLLNPAVFSEYDSYFNQFKTIVPKVALVELDFTAITNSNVPSFNSTATQTGILNGSITRGTGLKVASGLSAGFSSSTIVAYTSAASTFADAMTNNEYLEIAFETKNSIKASLHSIEWVIRKSAPTALTKYRWYYSIDSELKTDFKPIDEEDKSFVHNSTAAVQAPIDLKNISALQTIGSNKKVYLRLYIFNSINSSSTIALRNTDDMPAFTLYGDVEQDLSGNLLGWDFSTSSAGGTRSDGNEAFIKSNITNSNLNASELRRGPGLNATDASVTLQRGFTSVSSNVVESLADAEAFENYFFFNVTPKANVKISLEQLAFNLRRSSNGGDTYQWKYKINDGEFVALGPETVLSSTNTNGVYQPILNLNQISELQNATVNNVEFRLYVWNFKNVNTGTFAIGRSADNLDVALQLTGTAVNTALPVTLTKFEAKKANNAVNLNWSTSSEQNNSHFEVLKSNDAKTWTILTTVRGAENSNQTLNYKATDVTPANGINYYQLKQVDFDGKSSLSEIVNVTFDLAETNSLTTNYTAQKLTTFASGFIAGDAKIIVSNLNGQTLASSAVKLQNGINRIVIPVTLQKGLYILTLYTAKDKKSAKFIAEN